MLFRVFLHDCFESCCSYLLFNTCILMKFWPIECQVAHVIRLNVKGFMAKDGFQSPYSVLKPSNSLLAEKLNEKSYFRKVNRIKVAKILCVSKWLTCNILVHFILLLPEQIVVFSSSTQLPTFICVTVKY